MCHKIRCDENLKKLLIFWDELRPCLVSKNFQDFPSHRIFIHMHEALNVDKNKN